MQSHNLMAWLVSASLLPIFASASPGQTPPLAATNSAWEVPADHQAFTPRGYQSDGTLPAMGKGRQGQWNVRAAGFETPLPAQGTELPGRAPGFTDPTHPTGPAEPGCAAIVKAIKTRTVPVTSGYGLALKQQ
jgi:hypothetical protein